MEKRRYRHIGLILALAALIVIFVSNVLLSVYGVDFGLSINGLPYYINFIFLILAIILYSFFRFFHYKLIPFVISVIVMQNLLISIVVDVSSRSANYDIFNDFSFVIAVPVAFIGAIIWGIVFDYHRNRINKHE